MLTLILVVVVAVIAYFVADHLKWKSEGSPIEVRSSTGGSTVYKVSLRNLTCSCPDYRHRADMYGQGELGRICKHLQKALLDADAIPDPATRAALADPKSNRHGMCLDIDGVVAIHNESRGWFNVYAPDSTGDIKRYGYHPEEQRWARKEIPANGSNIEREIISALEED